MKYLIVLIFLGIVIESMFVVGQQFNSDDVEDERQTSLLNADNNGNNRRPAANLNGKLKRVQKVRKVVNKQSVPIADKRFNRPLSNSQVEADSVPASSIKKSVTVNNYDENDDDIFSRRRARFLFRQRVGK